VNDPLQEWCVFGASALKFSTPHAK